MKLTRIVLILTVLTFVYSAVVLAMMIPWVIITAMVILLLANAKKGYVALTSHGTARWAGADDLERAGMLNAKTGLILGRLSPVLPSIPNAAKALFSLRVKSTVACENFIVSLQKKFGKPKIEGPMVRLPKAVHCAVFAPTGVGKGVSIVIPHLLSCRDSMVVVDFKGENARLTADHRRKVFGHKIVILDPFKVVTQTPDCFNPLDPIDGNDPLAIDEVRDLAGALVIRTGKESEPHWNESAEVWISAMTALVAVMGQRPTRSLQAVRLLLTDSARMEDSIKLMIESNACHGMLARLGFQLKHYANKELNSTLTTTNRHMNFLDTLPVSDSTKSSSFDPSDLVKGKMTVYLVLPPDHMRKQSSLLRLWIGSMLRAVVKGGLQEKNKVHFLLDEAASLGHLEPLDDAVDKYRAFGIRLIFLYQSLGQLKKCFPDGQEQTLLSNVTQVFFGVNDPETAKYVSDRLGEETVIVASGGRNEGRESSSSSDGSSSVGRNAGSSDNWAQQGRHLLKPEEVAQLPERTAITFTPGIPPLWTTLVRYYESNGPGFFKRLYRRLQLFVTAVALFALSIALASAVTQSANAPQVAPNGSVNWGEGGMKNGAGDRSNGGGGGGDQGGSTRPVPQQDPVRDRLGAGPDGGAGKR